MVLGRSTGSMRDTTAPSVYGCVEDSQCLKPTASVCHRRKQNTSEFFPSPIHFMYDMQRKGRGKLSLCAILLTTPLLSSPQASFLLGCNPSPLLKAQHTWGAASAYILHLACDGSRVLLLPALCVPLVLEPTCPVEGIFSSVIPGAVN